MHTGVIWPRGVNIGNWQLIEAEMEGCQVRERIVEEMSFPKNNLHEYEWRLTSEMFNTMD